MGGYLTDSGEVIVTSFGNLLKLSSSESAMFIFFGILNCMFMMLYHYFSVLCSCFLFLAAINKYNFSDLDGSVRVLILLCFF